MAAETLWVERPRFPAQLWALAGDAPVTVRVSGGTAAPALEFPARISEVQPDAVVVLMAAGATPALLASGSREVELAWASAAGRHEQRCRVQAGHGSRRHWRLTPLGAPILLQRRRYLRVAASIDVVVEIGGRRLSGTTVEVSEGGFRLRIPVTTVSEQQPASVRLVIADHLVTLTGDVVRARDVSPPGLRSAGTAATELVIAFAPTGEAAEALRRLILNRQLRNRATRGP
jgi:hypothetical protein